MGIQFVFFAPDFRERFLQFLAHHDIPAQSLEQEPEGYLVEIPDDLPEDSYTLLEQEYHDIVEDQIIQATEEDEQAFQVLGVSVNGTDGQPQLVRIEGPLGRRLSRHFTPDEIHQLVDNIVHSYRNPHSGPLCHTNPSHHQ